MSESAARITLSAKERIMKIVGDVLIIETPDPDELPPLPQGGGKYGVFDSESYFWPCE
jgi:hypothetical protein